MNTRDPRAPKPDLETEILFSNKFWRNRSGEAVCVDLKRINGKSNVIDVRQWFTARDGTFRPTSRGICLAIVRLSDLKAAIDRAYEKAVELGLIAGEAKK